jgi:hypothetical protein
MSSENLPDNPRLINLTGRTFGRWTVLGYAGRDGDSHSWQCRCACGTQRNVRGSNLRKGISRSCGCLLGDVLQKRNLKHGHRTNKAFSPEWLSWSNMIRRCKPGGHKHYAGRGVKVCQRWRNSFSAFLSDMGMKPFPRAMIERENNDGDYTPENCRWATNKEQSRNRRNNRPVTVNGVTAPVVVHAERFGIKYRTALARLVYGWTPEEAFLTPVKGKR